MAKRQNPLTIGARVNEPDQARIDAAACLDGITRSEFVKEAALRAARERLAAAARDGRARRQAGAVDDGRS